MATEHELLHRAATYLADIESAPDATWWRDFLTLDGGHWILTEEGWEPGSALDSYREEDPDFQPLEEVNPPC